MQPLVGLIIVGLKSFLSQLTSEQIYSAFTMLVSIAYLFVCSFFVSKLAKIKWEYCFFLLILFPESYSIAYYPNTAIFSSFVFVIGLLLILKKPLNLLSILLLGIAPLFRIDILAIYPMIILLLWLVLDFKNSFKLSLFYALFIFLIANIGFTLLKVNPIKTLVQLGDSVSLTKTTFDIVNFLKINATFYSIPTILMILYGLLSLIKSSNYKLLALSILPIFILYFIYRDFSGGAPKHIHYLLPFIVLLCAISLKYVLNLTKKKKYLFLSAICMLILIQGLIGLRFYPESKPWIGKNYSVQNPRPTVISLFSLRLYNYGLLEAVIGAGQVIPTADELMLLSGNFFTPYYWHDVKKNELEERKVLGKMIQESKDTMYFMTTQASDWPLSQNLHNIGFTIKNNDIESLKNSFSSDFVFMNGEKVIRITCKTLDRNPESFNSAISTFKHRPLYIMTLWDWQQYFVNERRTFAMPVSNQFSIVHD